MPGLVLTLIETVLEAGGATVSLPDGSHRMVYAASGDITVTDRRNVVRLGEGMGCYCEGEVEVRAEAPSRIWTWQLGHGPADPDRLSGSEIRIQRALEDLAPNGRYVLRLDRVYFPPGATAFTHVHPGPGIRMVKSGAINIQQNGESHWYKAGDVWFERGPDPVLAPTTEEEATTFVRCLVLPEEWRGRNTISYVDPADNERPKLQQYHRFIDTLIDV